MPSTFAVTALVFCAILAAAGASMLVIYGVGGLALAWQLLIALAAAGSPPPLLADDDVADDA